MIRQAISPRLAIRIRLNMPARRCAVGRNLSSSDAKPMLPPARAVRRSSKPSAFLCNISVLSPRLRRPIFARRLLIVRPAACLMPPRNSPMHHQMLRIPDDIVWRRVPWHSQSTTPPPISKRKPPKARSNSTTGSATNGPCCSRTPRISRRSAPPNSATWPRSSRSSTSAASRSSACRSIRSTSTPAGPPTSRRRKASRRTIR